MAGKKDINLNSAEMAALWATYMNNSMTLCSLRYFIETVKDNEIQAILKDALSLSKEHIEKITNIFNQQGFPIPHGFGDQDVNLTAPKLFTDIFVLFYLRFMTRIGLNAYSTALPFMKRNDTRSLLTSCLTTCAEIANKISEALLLKGEYPSSPYISIVDSIDIVKDRNFLKGLFGERRTLNAIEISELYSHMLANFNANILVTGFSQVSESKQVREHMIRGKEITAKHIDIIRSIIAEDDISAPLPAITGVTDSTMPPFSDKLIMFHINTICAFGISTDGLSISTSMRPDLTATYTRFIAEIQHYLTDGAKIMIDNEWMEQPPQAINHKELART